MENISLTTKMFDSGLISKDTNSTVLNYCVKYNINTIEDFIKFYENNGILSKARLEILGLVDILNFSCYSVYSNELISLLNSKFLFKKTVVNLSIKWDKKDLNQIRRLGLTSEEARQFIYFASHYKNKTLIEVIQEFIKPENKCHRGWFGENKNAIYMRKIKLLYNLYFSKQKNDGMDNEVLAVNDLTDIDKLYVIKNRINQLQEYLSVMEKSVDKKIELLQGSNLCGLLKK